MMNDHTIKELFPDLYKIFRPITVGSSPLIISGNSLHIDEVQMLPIVQGLQPRIDPNTKIKMYATLGGYSVLNAILKTDPRDYLKFLWSPCQDTPVWIGSVKYSDGFSDLLKVFDITKFGDAAVEDYGSTPALITLTEILTLYKKGVIKSQLHLSEIGSNMVEVSSESSLIETIRLMFEKRIRRVFLRVDHNNEDPEAFSFISTRNIIRFLFSPLRVDIAEKEPERWADAKLSEIEGTRAKIIHGGHIINQGALEIGDGIDDCLVCEGERKIVSRWDMIMKPWRANNYSFAGD